MTKHYSTTRRDIYRATESKRRERQQERATARRVKLNARIAGGAK